MIYCYQNQWMENEKPFSLLDDGIPFEQILESIAKLSWSPVVISRQWTPFLFQPLKKNVSGILGWFYWKCRNKYEYP